LTGFLPVNSTSTEKKNVDSSFAKDFKRISITEWFIPSSKETMSQREVSYIMIKPDGVQRGLVGEIISRFERRGFKLVGLKFVTPTRELAEAHYGEHKGKGFFAGLVDFLTSGPVVAMVRALSSFTLAVVAELLTCLVQIWEGDNVVTVARSMIGATKPSASAPGTIRGDLAVDVGRNVIHGSDSVESAQNEIKLWFGDAGVEKWTSATVSWVYEKS
jgi:nucleoside-diphosphate kinase